MSRDGRTRGQTDARIGWKEILDVLRRNQRARSVSSQYIRAAARERGLTCITQLQHMAEAIAGNIPGKPLDRSTLDVGNTDTRSKVFALYAISSPDCIAAIENEDADAFERAYDAQHKDHRISLIPNTGEYADGAGGKRAAGQAAKAARETVAVTATTTAAPAGWPLYLEDCDDTMPPVSLTLGNVGLLLSSQRIAVGEDGFLSAIVRCHEAKWGGLAVAATACTLTLYPTRRVQRSVNPPPLKDVVLINARGDKIVVERLGPMTIRIRVVAEPDKKARPIGEIELPGALWAILDARVGDVFACELCVLLRDVSADAEPDESNALINSRGDPLDDTMMLKLEKRFEEKKRVFISADDNKSALLHKPRVTLAADSKKA